MLATQREGFWDKVHFTRSWSWSGRVTRQLGAAFNITSTRSRNDVSLATDVMLWRHECIARLLNVYLQFDYVCFHPVHVFLTQKKTCPRAGSHSWQWQATRIGPELPSREKWTTVLWVKLLAYLDRPFFFNVDCMINIHNKSPSYMFKPNPIKLTPNQRTRINDVLMLQRYIHTVVHPPLSRSISHFHGVNTQLIYTHVLWVNDENVVNSAE